MAQNLTAIIPSELHRDTLQYRVIGELIVDRTAVGEDGRPSPMVYMVVKDPSNPNRKTVELISGAGKYNLIEHIARAHAIGNVTPNNYDRSTMWYNTAMVYSEGEDATKAFISVRTEKSPGVWGWTKVLPYSLASTVIIGKDSSNNPITLDSVIRNNKLVESVPRTVEEASYGQLYINDRNELYFKNGPAESDQRLVGTVNQYTRERLTELIKVSETQPVNFTNNTIWYRERKDDADMALAPTKYASFVNPTNSTGLKFVRDNNNKMKNGATLLNQNKSVTIEAARSSDRGYVYTNFPFNENGKYYMEFYISESRNLTNPTTVTEINDLFQIYFLGNGFPYPTGDTLGRTQESAVITNGYLKYNGNTTNKDMTGMGFDKTIFVIVEKNENSYGIKAGHVLNNGDLKYIWGTSTSHGFTMNNLARVAIGAKYAPELTNQQTNATVTVDIKPLLVKELPEGYIPVNNSLPGESVFTNYALATNARSVHLGRWGDRNSVLENWVQSGRLISTLRKREDAPSALVGEILLDYGRGEDKPTIYVKTPNHSIIPLAGNMDEVIRNHINNSITVTHSKRRELTVNREDPSKVYIHKQNPTDNTPFDYSTLFDRDVTINGNESVIDNSPSGNTNIYKTVVPRTISDLVHFRKNGEGDTVVYSTLTEVINDIDERLDVSSGKNVIYNTYRELGIADADFNSTLNTVQKFLKELGSSENKFKNNGIYIESINSVTGNNNVRAIDRYLNAPESGIMHMYKSANGDLLATLRAGNNTYTKTFTRASNWTNNDPWITLANINDINALENRLSTANQSLTNINTTLGNKVDRSYFDTQIQRYLLKGGDVSTGYTKFNGGMDSPVLKTITRDSSNTQDNKYAYFSHSSTSNGRNDFSIAAFDNSQSTQKRGLTGIHSVNNKLYLMSSEINLMSSSSDRPYFERRNNLSSENSPTSLTLPSVESTSSNKKGIAFIEEVNDLEIRLRTLISEVHNGNLSSTISSSSAGRNTTTALRHLTPGVYKISSATEANLVGLSSNVIGDDYDGILKMETDATNSSRKLFTYYPSSQDSNIVNATIVLMDNNYGTWKVSRKSDNYYTKTESEALMDRKIATMSEGVFISDSSSSSYISLPKKLYLTHKQRSTVNTPITVNMVLPSNYLVSGSRFTIHVEGNKKARLTNAIEPIHLIYSGEIANNSVTNTSLVDIIPGEGSEVTNGQYRNGKIYFDLDIINYVNYVVDVYVRIDDISGTAREYKPVLRVGNN